MDFESNRGQTDKQVDFLVQGAGYGLFLSHAEALIVLQRGSARPDSLRSGTTVRLRSVGANASSGPQPLGQQSRKSNYFIGNLPEHWHTGVPNYAKVRYRNVYPGIDLIYCGNQRQLEYDLVVSPGANPTSILLDFRARPNRLYIAPVIC